MCFLELAIGKNLKIVNWYNNILTTVILYRVSQGLNLSASDSEVWDIHDNRASTAFSFLVSYFWFLHLFLLALW